jgi:sulfur carrier protein
MTRPGQPVGPFVSTSGPSVWVNGEPQNLPAGATMTEFLRELGLTEDRVAVELDGRILPRSQWAATELAAGARLEIVHFVGGG